MTDYFHLRENLHGSAVENVVIKKDAIETTGPYDIALYFSPYDDLSGNNKDFISTVGDLKIETGADEILWNYGVNSKRTPTYGGEVVQILSMFADKMRMKGTCRNYEEQRRIYEYFKKYIGYTTGSSGKERQQKYLWFRYPARGWSFIVMVTAVNGMRMATNQTAPEWNIVAEVVSENDRYALGEQQTDKYANVLSVNIPAAKTTVTKTTAGNNKMSARANFKLLRDKEPFGDLMAYADGRKGKIPENFEALTASWATGDITTVRNNPLLDPEKTADEIYKERFGSEYFLNISGSGTGTGGPVDGSPADTTGATPTYGSKQRVFATSFGGSGDDNGLGSGGKKLDEYPDSYAELSTNMYNSANGPTPDGKSNDYAALGKLEYETPIRVTYKGKSKVLYKRDTGFGGPGPDGKRGTADDPKIDIWHTAAKELGFNGFDWVDIEIGTVGAGGGAGPVTGSSPPNLTNDIRTNAVAWAQWMLDNKKYIYYMFGGGHGMGPNEDFRTAYAGKGIDFDSIPTTYPTAKRTTPPSLPLYLDCSSSTSLCLMWGGAQQAGVQATGGMIGFKHINRSDCGPGDLVIYGPSTGDTKHVAMVMKVEGDQIMCFSHGGGTADDAADPMASPDYVPDNYRSDIVAYVRWPGLA